MTSTELAFLAGALDAKGIFSSSRGSRGSASIGLASVYPELPRMLHSAFGGRLYVKKPTTKKGRRALEWKLFTRTQLVACLEKISPLLQARREHADILLRVLKVGSIQEPAKRGKAERELIAALQKRLHKLNVQCFPAGRRR